MISILEKLFNKEREVPQIETAPILTPTISKPDESVDIEHYRKAAQNANELFVKHNTQENTMNPITTSPKTSIAGVLASLPLLGLAISFFISGDITNGIAHGVAGIGVLLGLLQAADASKVADAVKQITKPNTPTE